MHDLELNKILAACLVAGIIASASGFAAKKLIHPHEIKALGAEASGDAGMAAAPEAPDPILSLIATASADHGKSIAKACGACHNFDKGGPNGVGPNLWDVLNRGKAAKTDFSYSDDMSKHKGEKWTYEDLNHFIWKPKSFVPGTKMTFPGLSKGQDRADVIAFLRTLTDSPPGLPGDADIAAEKKALGPKEPPAGVPQTDGQPATKANDKAAAQDAGKSAPEAGKDAGKAPPDNVPRPPPQE